MFFSIPQPLQMALKALSASVLTLLVVSVITFLATSSSGKDVARNALGRSATPEQLEAYAQTHGLDRPIAERYASWLSGFLRGDWGQSPQTQRSIAGDIVPRMQRTLILAALSVLVSVPAAILVGLYGARRIGSGRDTALLVASVVVAAMPEFVVGVALMLILSIWLGLLPVDSSGIQFGSVGDHIEAYVLPTLTLALAIIPHVGRIARASISDALREPYVQAATLRGLSRRRVIWRHVMPNAAVPMVNAVGINLVYLLSGVIVVENVFGFPGIGQELVRAITLNDTETVLAITMILGVGFVLIGLVSDLLVVRLNPRLKHFH